MAARIIFKNIDRGSANCGGVSLDEYVCRCPRERELVLEVKQKRAMNGQCT